jgi:hypothetical protein
MRLNTLAATAAFTILMMASAAHASNVRYYTELNGPNEMPPNDSKATGQVIATLDTVTKVFSYDVTYDGLSGPATAAHFHAPANPGSNAAPVVPVPAGAIMSGKIHGTATLTDAQVNDLNAGLWYFNIHTTAHPGGEIRGQMDLLH